VKAAVFLKARKNAQCSADAHFCADLRSAHSVFCAAFCRRISATVRDAAVGWRWDGRSMFRGVEQRCMRKIAPSIARATECDQSPMSSGDMWPSLTKKAMFRYFRGLFRAGPVRSIWFQLSALC